MVGWHHQLNGHEFEQTLGDSERQGKPGMLQSMSREDPLRKECLPTPVYLPGQFHGQRRQADYCGV